MVADRYHALKQEEARLKKELAAASAEVNALLDAGEAVVASDGTEYIRRVQDRREYKVSGKGGILALLRKHTELSPDTLLSVVAAGVAKLPGHMAEELSFVSKEVRQVVKK